MKGCFNVLAVLNWVAFAFDLVAGLVAYVRDPSVVPGFWLGSAGISLFLAVIFGLLGTWVSKKR
jgi:hypothetical protein